MGSILRRAFLSRNVPWAKACRQGKARLHKCACTHNLWEWEKITWIMMISSREIIGAKWKTWLDPNYGGYWMLRKNFGLWTSHWTFLGKGGSMNKIKVWLPDFILNYKRTNQRFYGVEYGKLEELWYIWKKLENQREEPDLVGN